VQFSPASRVRVWEENVLSSETKIKGNKITVAVAAKGITALALNNAQVETTLQHKYINDGRFKLSDRSFRAQQTCFGEVTAMIISMARPLTSAYVWLEADVTQLEEAVLHYSTGAQWAMMADDEYPFEFTVPLDANVDDFNYYIEGLKPDETVEKSEVMKLQIF
jgi:hypothetical protein